MKYLDLFSSFIKKALFTFSSLSILTLFLIVSEGYGQALLPSWQKALGGTAFEYANDIQNTTDGGYVLAGFATSNDGDLTFNHGLRDYWVVKLDSARNIQWQISLGGSADDQAYEIRQTADGGYIVAGATASSDGDVTNYHVGDFDYWIVKLSPTGTVQWQKTLGGSDSDIATSIDLNKDGGYVIAGITFSNDGDVSGNHGNGDVWVVVLDSAGTIEWQQCYGGSAMEGETFIRSTEDGGYVFAAAASSHDGNIPQNYAAFDYAIVKINTTGVVEWRQSYGGTVDDQPFEILQTRNKGYIVVGRSGSDDGAVTGHHGPAGIPDFWVVRLGQYGSLEWRKSFGGSSEDVAHAVVETIDGGFIIGGYSMSVDGDVTGIHGSTPGNSSAPPDFWMVRTDGSGNLLWEKTFGGSGADYMTALVQNAAGLYIAAGVTGSQDGDVIGNHSADHDFWVLALVDSCKLPPMLTAIGMTGGYHAVCPGDTRTYKVKQIAGVTYHWTLPAGANINSGQGTSSISVTYDSTFISSHISVQTVNSCGMSSPFSKLIIRNNLNPPDYIYVSGGGTSLCFGDVRTFTVDTAVGQGISYFWTVPPGAVLLSGQNTTSIDVRFDTLYTTSVEVTAARVNACGMSQPRKKDLFLNRVRPLAPAVISGPFNHTNSSGQIFMCPGDTIQLTSSSTDSGIVWTWVSFNSSIAIISGQNSSTVTIAALPGYAGGQVVAYIKSVCNGLESFRAKSLIYRGVPLIPSGIMGQTTGLCGQQNAPFSVFPGQSGGYSWQVSGSPVIVNGQGTNAIEVSFDSSGYNGTISVTASNGCGVSKTRTLLISSSPATPDPISGPSIVCSNSTDNIYSISPVFSATGYRWIGPTGSTITANGITSTNNTLITTATTVSVDYGTVSPSSQLKVRAINDCANGGVRTLALTPCLLRLYDNNERSAEIYPNPSNGYFIVELSDPEEFKEVTVENIFGQVIYSRLLNAENLFTIELSDASSGIYQLRLMGENGIVTRQIVIEN